MAFDLDGYFDRIGYGGATTVSAATLAALHEAQAGAIPFENTDTLMGRPLDLTADGIAAKLVQARRGGYCYEQNLLLLAALRALGFEVTALAARVQLGFSTPRPRTHALLRVHVDGADWIADCGFGSLGLLAPVPLAAGAVANLPLVAFRIRSKDGGYLMQARRASGDWEDLYLFSLESQHEVDFVMANHFTATYPRSPFIRSLIVARVTRDRRAMLLDRELTVMTAGGTERRTISDAPGLFAVLAAEFGLACNDPELARRALTPKEPWG